MPDWEYFDLRNSLQPSVGNQTSHCDDARPNGLRRHIRVDLLASSTKRPLMLSSV
jgi:hypothetical protein